MKSYWIQLIELFLFVAIGITMLILNIVPFVLMIKCHGTFGLLFILTIPSMVVWFKILYDKYL